MSILAKLQRQHEQFAVLLKSCLDKLSDESMPEMKSRVFELLQLVVAHGEVEAEHLFPEFEEKLGKEKLIAERLFLTSLQDYEKADIKKGTELLALFEQAKDLNQAKQALSQLILHFESHMEKEEKILFPMIRDVLGQERIEELGQKVSLPDLND